MKKLTYKSVLKFLTATIFFCSFCKIKNGAPFCIALVLPLFFANFSPLCLFLSLSSSTLVCNLSKGTPIVILCALLCCLSCLFYKLSSHTPKFLASIFTLLALTPFLIADFSLSLEEKLAYSAIIALLTPIFTQAMNLLFVNKFTRKAEGEQVFALCIFYLLFAIGLINLTCIELVYSLSVLITLLACYFFKNSKAFYLAILSALPLVVFTGQISAIALFSLYCVTALLFVGRSKLLSSIAVIITQTAYALLSGAFNTLNYPLLVAYFLPFVLFLFIPHKFLDYLERGFKRFDKPTFSREIVNWERAEISNKLYTLSNAFNTLSQTMHILSPLNLSDRAIEQKVVDEIVFKVCESCPHREKCLDKNKPISEDLTKLFKVGISKGKVNLIDLSRDFSNYCYCTGNMIFEMNKLLENYQDGIKAKSQTEGCANLLKLQSEGVCKALKNLAFSFADKIKFDKKFEFELFDYLSKNAIEVAHVIVVGDKLHLLLTNTNTDFCLVAKLLSVKLAKRIRISKKLSVDGGILAIFSPAPKFDACFGVAQRTKHASSVSGDTHSLVRIDANNFIALLCDGMGSGEEAYNNSQSAISLIEALFKVGIDKDATIDLANRLLSLCAEDSFCALDLAVIDLENGRADLIKIGATFGAILSGDEIKIIENNALPLGILQEISPTTISLELLDGDVIILLSDGVTDAFFSSTDTVDFLQRENCKNPQTLANKLVEFAYNKNSGVAKDDMTAVVVKIFKNS